MNHERVNNNKASSVIPTGYDFGASLLTAPPSSAVIRQTSIDDLFNDINRTVSMANGTATDNYQLQNIYSFMVDDGFINDIATPVTEEPAFVPPGLGGEVAALWTSPIRAAGESNPFGSTSVVRETQSAPLPSVGDSTLAPTTLTKHDKNVNLDHGYDLATILKYIEVILFSTPRKELHITVLGTIFHRGSEHCVVDKATRKFLFQQGIEIGLQNGVLARVGDSPVNFQILLNNKYRATATYTTLEKNVMWILKDEYQLVENVRGGGGHNGVHAHGHGHGGHSKSNAAAAASSNLDDNEFISVKTLQYAAKSKQMRNGMFIFPLNVAYDNGNPECQIPAAFLTEIPCENSSYAVLFQQVLQHFEQLKIIEYSANSTGIRLLPRARKAALLHPPTPAPAPAPVAGAPLSKGAVTSSVNASPSVAGSGASGGAGGGSKSVDSVAASLAPRPAQAASGSVGADNAIVVPMVEKSAAAEAPVGLPLRRSRSLTDLPWEAQGNFLVLEIEADKATVIQVPTLLKMAAVTDAMDVGDIRKLELETQCKVRDISIRSYMSALQNGRGGGGGRTQEEYRILITGDDYANRQQCLEHLKRIMNASRSTSHPTPTVSLDDVLPSVASAPLAAPSPAVAAMEQLQPFRLSANNRFIDFNPKWEHPWGDAFSPRIMNQPVYIYYDWSNCMVNVNHIGLVVRLAEQGRAPIKRKVVAGSCADPVTKQNLDRHWSIYHEFETYILLQMGTQETFIDDLLHAHITQDVASEAITRSMRTHFGDHDAVRPVLVLFSNDANDNNDGVIGSTFPRCLQFALDNGWSIEVWVNCPKASLSHYHKRKRAQLGDRYKIFFLREFVGENVDLYQNRAGPRSDTIPPFNPLTDL